jgi:hypothetical protein
MDDKNEVEASAKKHRDALAEWLKNAKQIADVTPIIQQASEIADFQYDLIASMPSDVEAPIRDELLSSISGSHDFWQAQLPKIQPTSTAGTLSGLAMSVYDSTSAYDYLTIVAVNGNEAARGWAQPRVRRYRELQIGQQRIEAVHQTMKTIKTELADEFQTSVNAYRAALPQVKDYQGAGIQLRNVLAHTKGELISKAMRLSKKQKLKWYQMASILAKGGTASPEHSLLITQEPSFKSLHDRLTIIAKNQSVIARQDLEDIFTEWVDHLFTVLNLVDLAKFRDVW